MTREELFSAFPRPWRLDDEEAGAVLCADGFQVLVVDAVEVDDSIALAELVVDLVNGAEQ